MSTVFASQDVAALVAAFPPSHVGEIPSLVRNSSGDALVDFRYVERRFQDLLSAGDERLQLTELPKRLDVAKDVVSVLLDRCSDEVNFSQNGQALIPQHESRSILAKLRYEASNSMVELTDWSRSLDIHIDHLLRSLDSDPSQHWRRPASGDGMVYVTSDNFYKQLVVRVTEHVRHADAEIVNLTAEVRAIPSANILLEMAKEPVASAGGELRVNGSDIVFIPAGHATAELQKASQQRANKIREFVEELDQKSYTVVGPLSEVDGPVDSVLQSVLDQYEQLHATKPKLRKIPVAAAGSRKTARSADSSTTSTLLMTEEAFTRYTICIEVFIKDHAEKVWLDSEKTVGATEMVHTTLQRCLSRGSSEATTVMELLTRSEHMEEFERLSRSQITMLEEENNNAFVEFINESLVAPVQLYAAALTTIVDATLKQNLQAFLLDHFQTNFLHYIGRDALSKGSFAEKSRNRELEKLQQASKQATSFDELHVAVHKMTRKLKIPAPDDQKLAEVKKRQLVQHYGLGVVIEKVASVALQNTIWILLGAKSYGLFISAGKDTSRMIRQYEALVGDAETVQKLFKWRDLAKKNEAGQRELLEMRDTASAALKSIDRTNESA